MVRPDRTFRYALAVVATAAGVLSQYVIPSSWIPAGLVGFVLGLLLVYGVGLAAFFLLFGITPLRNFFRRSGLAGVETVRWYGVFGFLGFILAFVLLIAYLAIEPHRAEELISRQTQVIQAASSEPLFYILFSIFFVGFVEETLFRGYVLGTVLHLRGTRSWSIHALWTSFLFAGVHLYYAQTYLEVSPVYYAQLVTLALAFSYIYIYSGGNLLLPALLHGAFDAISFLSLAPGMLEASAVIRYALLFGCAFVALSLYARQGRFPRPQWEGRQEILPGYWPPGVPPEPPGIIPLHPEPSSSL